MLAWRTITFNRMTFGMVESAKRDVHFIHFLLSRPCFVCADAAIIEFATLSFVIFA